MSTSAIWCRVVRSRDVRSRDFSVPARTNNLTLNCPKSVKIIFTHGKRRRQVNAPRR